MILSVGTIMKVGDIVEVDSMGVVTKHAVTSTDATYAYARNRIGVTTRFPVKVMANMTSPMQPNTLKEFSVSRNTELKKDNRLLV